jgi:hypothetical protein
MVREGDGVSVDAGGKVGRPGAVLRIIERGIQRRAFVAWGTGTFRPEKRHVAVLPGAPAYVALELSKPTYFYPGNVHLCPPTDLEVRGSCTPKLLIELQRLFGF